MPLPRADYLNKVVVKGKQSSNTKVSDIMTPSEVLLTVTPQHRCAGSLCLLWLLCMPWLQLSKGCCCVVCMPRSGGTQCALTQPALRQALHCYCSHSLLA